MLAAHRITEPLQNTHTHVDDISTMGDFTVKMDRIKGKIMSYMVPDCYQQHLHPYSCS